jgi:2-keto-4-pentenoate hydratase/2-oxohepta-3-ene-1,7-dioic acid hydratase in catechol pathway
MKPCNTLPGKRVPVKRKVINTNNHLYSYTASNDVSSRAQQFAQSQWCYSKSFDGACPIGPAFVPASQVKSIGDMYIKGSKNGKVVQESKLE